MRMTAKPFKSGPVLKSRARIFILQKIIQRGVINDNRE